MKKLKTSAPINPKQLNFAQLEALTEELYPIQCDIFDGVSRTQFQKYVITPDTKKTRIFLLRNAENETVGYFSFHVYHRRIERNGKRRSVYIFRGETGVMQAYRGKVQYVKPLLREILRFLISRGWPEAYLVAAPIHPTPYCILQRSIHEIYPRPAVETPTRLTQVMDDLSEALQLKEPAGAGPLVKDVGWIVKNCDRKHRAYLRSSASDVQFFLQRNPDYRKGHGMMVLAPASLKNAFQTLRMHVGKPRIARNPIAIGFQSFSTLATKLHSLFSTPQTSKS